MRYLGLIPLRGGSKSIPRKNVKLIAGKPLFAWSLQAAIDSQIFTEIVISTDCEQIAEEVRQWFPQVIIDQRPSELATDEASSESVMLHVAERYEFEVMALIQATSPLTTSEDFAKARQHFESEGADSLVTGVEKKTFIWVDNKPFNYDPKHRPRRQVMKSWLQENGAFYFTRKNLLLSEKSRLVGKICVYPMHEDTELELDELRDWERVEELLKKQNVTKQNITGQIKLAVFDVDGVMTDGGMYYGKDGEALKRFNTRDAQGMALLMKSGIDVMVITAENSESVHQRMQKLSLVEKYHPAVENKWMLLQEQLRIKGIAAHEVAYIGDDVGDLECLQNVGFSACPFDAVDVIQRNVNYRCARPGGHGAVREFCDYLLQQMR